MQNTHEQQLPTFGMSQKKDYSSATSSLKMTEDCHRKGQNGVVPAIYINLETGSSSQQQLMLHSKQLNANKATPTEKHSFSPKKTFVGKNSRARIFSMREANKKLQISSSHNHLQSMGINVEPIKSVTASSTVVTATSKETPKLIKPEPTGFKLALAEINKHRTSHSRMNSLNTPKGNNTFHV
jgi:hypothetical protein